MSYVGAMQGDFVQETTFRYVGYGGDHSNVRPRRDLTCLVTSLCMSLLLLPALLWWCRPGEENQCKQDLENWKFTWSKDKQEFCCRTQGMACAPPPQTSGGGAVTTIGPALDPYNCADGEANWQAGWSVGKKDWCCKIHGKGCNGGPALPAAGYDCEAGFNSWVNGWSVLKKTWCCKTAGKACRAPLGLLTPGYGAGVQGRGGGARVATPPPGFVPFAQAR